MVDINICQPVMGKPMKFQRRNDLTLEIRLLIAFSALMDNRWGTITYLAKRYAISRTFVYMLESQLNGAIVNTFSPTGTCSEKQISIDPGSHIFEFALLLRLEGKCSIPAISGIMKKMNLNNSSVGSISEKLKRAGTYLPNTIAVSDEHILYVYLAVDEVFSHAIPLLISVDPISTAILRIELAASRKTEDWINHFDKLKESGVDVVIAVSDEGKGICSAIKTSFPEINRQPDTFHAISHRLGKWVNSLEKAAFATIAEEYQRESVFESSKTENMIQKRMDAYFEAKTKAEQAITLYEDYKFLYHCIIDNLQVFDKKGNPRNRQDAEENIRIALDYMISLPINKIKKEINTIYNLLEDLLNYLDTARQAIKNLTTKGIQGYIIQTFSLAWQYQKNVIKAKNTKRRKYFAAKEKEQLDILKEMLGDDFDKTMTTVYLELDKIIQSSAIVENVNSIVRAFLNTSRNKINQEMLNLIMFYHNHRRYKAGKRKGKTPMELLLKEKQDKDWLEMLMEIIQKQKDLAIAA
jgi:hypothetical protein